MIQIRRQERVLGGDKKNYLTFASKLGNDLETESVPNTPIGVVIPAKINSERSASGVLLCGPSSPPFKKNKIKNKINK